ncbi:hypothetical protein [Kamptonema formosum]|uniref:hypothetical protein n=1 Tax=Kamptonema formosum TaxID=331992 RepID=UPI0003499DE1|nr:hypothetical protein [Oscillatoria sp. PCC 10802]
MSEANLTPCAEELYGWVLRREGAGGRQKIDLRDFRAWAQEYGETPYREREILQALGQLEELELIQVAKTEVTLDVKPAARGFPASGEGPNRLRLVFLSVLSSFAVGLTPLAVGLAFPRTQHLFLPSAHAWSALAEKDAG